MMTHKHITFHRGLNPKPTLTPLKPKHISQGPFYCGIGPESAYGRPLAEAHLEACMKAGLNISGINSEVGRGCGVWGGEARRGRGASRFFHEGLP